MIRFITDCSSLKLGRRIPLQRFRRPEALVGAATFLAWDAASYITGQVLTDDAGLSIALQDLAVRGPLTCP